jgi:hypothetical protein
LRLGSRGCVGTHFLLSYFPLHPTQFLHTDLGRERTALPEYKLYRPDLVTANSNATLGFFPVTRTTRSMNPKYLQHQTNATTELHPDSRSGLHPMPGARHPRSLGSDRTPTRRPSTARPECMPAMSAQIPTYRKHAMALQQRNRPVVGVSPTCSHTGRRAIRPTSCSTTHLAFCSSLHRHAGDSSTWCGYWTKRR